MGFLDLFRTKKTTGGIDPLRDLVLARLRPGYLLDYDLKTWTVTDHNLYTYNDGTSAEEWELTAVNEKRYLERTTDDGEAWSLSRTIALHAVGPGNLRETILQHDDPPETVSFEGTFFQLDRSVGGHRTDASGHGHQELIQWEFLDEEEESFLSIVQWSEKEFSAVTGFFVEEYQFSNILPGGGQT